MNFIFFKSFRKQKDWHALDIFQNKWEGHNYYIQYDRSECTQDENFDLIYNGKIVYDKLDKLNSHKKFVSDITNTVWPLKDDIHGYFSGFIRNEGDTYLFTDPVGIQNIFYYYKNGYLVIASNLDSIYKIVKPSLAYAGLVLELMPHYSQFGKLTVFEDVHRLFPGELLKINEVGEVTSFKDYTIKSRDEEPEKGFAQKMVDLIEREHSILFSNDNKALLSLSGGIDSRINLAPFINSNHKFVAINYGEEELIDTKIPKSIAKKFDFDLEVINPEEDLFLNKEQVDDVVTKTDALYINVWHSIILSNKFAEGQLFLLGDMLDILRAKSISSLRNRNFRMKHYIDRFFFSKKLALNPLTEDNKNKFQQKRINKVLKAAKRKLNCFQLSESESEHVLDNITKDIESYFEFLEGFNPKYLESYEELFYLFTNGRLKMGKQLNLLRYRFNPEIPLCNIKILRKVLNVNPRHRYADELTAKMFKTKQWKRLGKFSTAQNPFFSYNSPYYIMLFGWFLRSKLDVILTKISLASKGRIKRTRVFKNLDYYKVYTNKEAYNNFKESIKSQDVSFDFDEALQIFNNRKNKKAWPIASMDLTPYIQVAHYINKYGND